MKPENPIHPDLRAAYELLYQPNALSFNFIAHEEENKGYGACIFTLNNHLIKFRVAKTTPKKSGQFVVFWKRNKDGSSIPYDSDDQFDFLVVSVRTQDHFGHFVFPKNIVLQNGLLSRNGAGGKRAMRVYPPGEVTKEGQAKKTQSWQSIYFIELSLHRDNDKIRKIFG